MFVNQCSAWPWRSQLVGCVRDAPWASSNPSASRTHPTALLERLTVRERPGKTAFRFWQEGSGYDRNLMTTEAVQASIDYIHMNPVRRGLVDEARLWRWSSCRWYTEESQCRDEALPTVEGCPAEFCDEA